jgi:hypothetical protein
MRTALVLALVLLAFLSSAVATDRPMHPDKIGEADDTHGSIAWRSSATQAADGSWDYARCVTNRSTERRCRIVWTVGGEHVLTNLPEAQNQPVEKRVHVENNEDGPKPADGKIAYNGGPAAGDGKKDAPVWSPKKETKSVKGTSGTANLGFVMDGRVEEVELTCKSKVGGQRRDMVIEYTIQLRARGGPNTINDVRIRWASSETRELARLLRSANSYDFVSEALRAPAEELPVFTFKATGITNAERRAAAIQILNATGKEILAEAPMSVVVPVE